MPCSTNASEFACECVLEKKNYLTSTERTITWKSAGHNGQVVTSGEASGHAGHAVHD